MSTTKKAAPKAAKATTSAKAVSTKETPAVAASKTEALRKESKKSLGKYNSDQLIGKLDKNALLGISREVAIEILEERKVDVKKYKEGAWVAPKGSVKASKETPAAKAAKTKEAKTEKPAKEKKEKIAKEKKESDFVAIDETLEKVKKVLENKENKKSDKIRGLLKQGYSVLQISKVESLDARYQMVRQVKVALDSVKETKEEAKK